MTSDIPRLFTGIAEGLAAVIAVLFWKKRFKIWPTIGITAVFLIIQIGFQIWAGTWFIELWIPGMIIAVLLMFGYVILIVKINVMTAICLSVEAFILAEFGAALEWQIYTLLVDNVLHSDPWHARIIFMVIMYVITFLGFFFIERYFSRKRKNSILSLRDVVSVLVIGVLVFAISNLSYAINFIFPFDSGAASWVYFVRTLVNFAGVVMLLTHRMMRYSLQTEKELLILNNLLKTQYTQYIHSKDNIDAINIKYHDLKHQLLAIRGETDAMKREKFIVEMENDLKHISGLTNTGSTVLDTILSTKNHECNEYHINLTSVIHGDELDFIRAIDLCSIFGNILDNAIESLKKVNDIEKRVLKLAVFRQNNFLLISCENYYESAVVFEDDSLVSTKSDKTVHGFGIKSVKSIVANYNGTVTIHAEDGWFKINILIPISSTQKE